MKKLLLFLLTLITCSALSHAETVTFVAPSSSDDSGIKILNADGSTSGSNSDESKSICKTYTDNDNLLSLTFAKGSASAYPIASNSEIRLYKNSTLTIKTIGSIQITAVSITTSTKYSATANIGTISTVGSSNYTINWTGICNSKNDLTLTFSAGQVKASTITVTYNTIADDFVEKPTFSRELNTITLSAAEGATVYYTLDGTDPSNQSTKYTGPFDIEKDCTLKAIAYNADGKTSEIVEENIAYATVTKYTQSTKLVAGHTYVIVGLNSTNKTLSALSSTFNTKYFEETIISGATNTDTEISISSLDNVNIITLEGSADNWFLKGSDGNYLQAGNTTSGSMTYTTKPETGAKLTAQTSNSSIKVVFGDQTSNNILRYNSGNPRFTCYGSGQNDVYFFAAPFDESQTDQPEITIDGKTVTITAEDGAKIYYTTDGNDPTESSTEYTSSFDIDETTTIKAIAIAEGKTVSPINEKICKIIKNIAQFIEEQPDEVTSIFSDATVIWQKDNNTYIKDDSGFLLVYGSIITVENGDVIKSGYAGKYYNSYGKIELSSPKNFVKADEKADIVQPEEKNISDITAELANNYVILKGVSLTDDSANHSGSNSSRYFKATDADGNSIYIYNSYDVDITCGDNVNVIGFANQYVTGSTKELQVIPVEVKSNTVAMPTFEDESGNALNFDGKFNVGDKIIVKSAEGTTMKWRDVAITDTNSENSGSSDITDAENARRRTSENVVWNTTESNTLTYELKENTQLIIKAVDAQGNESYETGFYFTNSDGLIATGVNSIVVDNANAPVEYFNLQGVRVANPQNGIYIRRQGTKATKVVIR